MKQDARTGKPWMSIKLVVAAAIVLCVGAVVFLVLLRRDSALARELDGKPLALESSSFADGGVISKQYTCDGAGISPELHWAGPPNGTRSLAIVMNDPDAPVDFTHWLLFNLPPGARELAEGASPSGLPQGSAEGTNSFDRIGYGGPCPPVGPPHHYVFRLYALDTRLDLPVGAGRRQLEAAINGHVLAQGRLIGLYRRTGE